MSPIALISVSDKTNIIPFVKTLVEKYDYTIISSGGTAKHLSDANIPVIKVADFTNSPEILEGRVKTLHPKIHGGILAKRDNKSHLKDLKENHIKLIDLVIVNLYPFKKKIENNCSWEEAIENIDIGGPSMIRSAAKNHKDVAVIVKPNQYDDFIQELNNGELSNAFKTKLACEAFEHTASYDKAISNWISDQKNITPKNFFDSYPLLRTLRYGENPHQKAFWYGLKNIGWNATNQLQGKELSYNNLLDLEAAISTVLEFGYTKNLNRKENKIAAIILKHNNPCGAAVGYSTSEAFKEALACDETSAFGGIVAFNKNVDSETAHILSKIFLECVVAPAFDQEALAILTNKKNLRLLEFKESVLANDNEYSCKSIMGGILIQENDNQKDNINNWELVTKNGITDDQLLDLSFAWKICKHVKSNAIVIAKGQKTIGIGAGQMNRVGAALIALNAANKDCQGAVLASDGFLPFADTVELAHEFGIKSIIQPGGSLRDDDSIKVCDKRGISMMFTKKRHFLH